MNNAARKSLILALALPLWSVSAESFDITADATSTLTAQVENLMLTIGINPIQTNYGLRSLSLYVNESTRFEPSSIWPDGTLVTAHALISSDEAIRTVFLVSESGLFVTARKYYSDRTAMTANTPPPPSNAKDMRLSDEDPAPQFNPPNISIQYVVFDDHWYSYYNIVSPLDDKAIGLMKGISSSLSGEGRRLIEEMQKQMESVQQAGPGYPPQGVGSPDP